MTRNDLAAFSQRLAELTEYFPGSKINLEVVTRGYFAACCKLTLTDVDQLFAMALKTCRFFPTVAEIHALGGQLAPGSRICATCHGDHSIHAGHDVRHYPAGPWCQTCHADMHTPAGYTYWGPCAPPSPLPHIPAWSTTPLTGDEVHTLMATLTARMPSMPAPIGEKQRPYQPQLTDEAVADRRQALRKQAEAVRKGMNQGLAEQGKPPLEDEHESD